MQTIYAFSYNPVIATGTNTTGTNWRMAYQQPIMLYKGTTNQFRLVVFSVNQKVVDLSNYDIQVQLVDKETQEHFVTKTASITTPTSGVATVTFTEQDLRNLQHRFYHLIARLVDPVDGSSLTSSEILYLDDNYGAFTPVTVENAWNFAPSTITTTDGPLLNVGNIIPIDDNLYWLGNVTNRWAHFHTTTANIANIAVTDGQIAAISNRNIKFVADTQILEFSDNSADSSHNQGDGGFLTFYDVTHQNDGPKFEVWYGDPDNINDPPGQHSLDIRAPDANSYVELASHDLNTFLGIKNDQVFVQIDWNNDPEQGWIFRTDGSIRLSRQGMFESFDGDVNIAINNGFIDFNTIDAMDNTHQTRFDVTGDVYFGGNLLPGDFTTPLVTPLYSLGSAERPWKDLHVSNSTIYLGNVALSVDNTGNLLVDGNVITGGGGTNTPIQPYVELTNNPFIIVPIVYGNDLTYTHAPNSLLADEIDEGLSITRGINRGLYNPLLEQEYDTNNNASPAGTEWNSEGWDNLRNIYTRTYTTLYQAVGGSLGNNILDYDLVMHDIANDKYYKVKFSEWGQNNGGSFAYTRTLIESIPEYFIKTDNGNEVDVFVADDGNGAGIGITRDGQQGIYNPYRDEGWTSNVSPSGTQWNIDGWDDLSDIESRVYTNFYAAYGNGGLGNKVPGSKAVMYIPETDTYYAIQWLSWTQGGNGGGFSYLRYELDLTKLNEGVKFSDGTVLKSAEGLGRIKSTASAGRRIEEVVGNKTVSVTERITTDYTSTSERTTNTNYEIFISRTAELDAILDPIFNNGVNAFIEISFDNITYREAWLSSIQSTEYWFYYQNNNSYVPQTQGDTVYIRISTGADPVVWWDKNDLPSGSSNFRGAVIDYHAYTGEGTFIGTIHIVDDSGENHISHTEVASGSTDSENDDLWVVQNEGTISYKRIDGEAKTLKIHWTAKVFYGEEFWD